MGLKFYGLLNNAEIWCWNEIDHLSLHVYALGLFFSGNLKMPQMRYWFWKYGEYKLLAVMTSLRTPSPHTHTHTHTPHTRDRDSKGPIDARSGKITEFTIKGFDRYRYTPHILYQLIPSLQFLPQRCGQWWLHWSLLPTSLWYLSEWWGESAETTISLGSPWRQGHTTCAAEYRVWTKEPAEWSEHCEWYTTYATSSLLTSAYCT